MPSRQSALSPEQTVAAILTDDASSEKRDGIATGSATTAVATDSEVVAQGQADAAEQQLDQIRLEQTQKHTERCSQDRDELRRHSERDRSDHRTGRADAADRRTVTVSIDDIDSIVEQDADDDANDDALTVDSELVRELVASGAADDIGAEQLDRRRKHREDMIEYRRRKKTSFVCMQREEQLLTAQLQSMVSLRASSTTRALSGLHSQQQLQRDAPALTFATVDDYVDVLVAKEQLHQESLALRQQLLVRQQYAQTVRSELVRSTRVTPTHPHLERLRVDSSSRYVTFLEHEAPFVYTPFTEHECRALAHATAQHVLLLQQQAVAGSAIATRPPLLVHFFQWRAYVALEHDAALGRWMIRYQFCKTFRRPMRSVEQAVAREWQVFHTPELYAQLYAAPVHLQVLQTWDSDDLSVALWNTPDPERTRKYRTTSVFARRSFVDANGDACRLVTITGVALKTPAAHNSTSSNTRTRARSRTRTTTSTSDTAAATAAGEPVVFTSHGSIYSVFKPGSEHGDVEMEHGGRVEVVNDVQAQYLMVEVGSSLVRLENLIFPFRVLRSDTE